MKRLTIVFLSALMFALPSFAQEWGVFGELNSSEIDIPGADRDMGLGAGATYLHPLSGDLFLRTGAGLIQKNSEVGATDIEFLYLEIPATVMFTVREDIGLFGGLNFDLKIDCDAGGSSCNNDESLVYNLVLGGRYIATRQVAFEGFLEMGMSDMIADYELDSTLGARFIYRF